MAISSTYMSSAKHVFMSGYGLSEEAASVKWMDRKQVSGTRSISACEEYLLLSGDHHLNRESTAKATVQYLAKQMSLTLVWLVVDFLRWAEQTGMCDHCSCLAAGLLSQLLCVFFSARIRTRLDGPYAPVSELRKYPVPVAPGCGAFWNVVCWKLPENTETQWCLYLGSVGGLSP